MKSNLGAALIAASLMLTGSTMAFAESGVPANAQSQEPLAPGKAAGVKEAQHNWGNTTWWIVGGAVVVGGVLIIANNSDNGHSSTTTTHP